MAYEWKFNPRPYSDEEAKKLLGGVMSAETTEWHYNTHQKGYVTALNNIEKALEGADRAARGVAHLLQRTACQADPLGSGLRLCAFLWKPLNELCFFYETPKH